MPSIFKLNSFVKSSGSVLIPDISIQTVVEDESTDTDTTESDNDTVSHTFSETTFVAEPKSEPEPEPEIIEEVKQKIMTSDELELFYQKELDIICVNMAEKAYADALNRKKGELKECMQKVDQQLFEMQELQTAYMEQYADELKYLAIEIAEKMIMHKIKEDDMILKKLLMSTMSSVKNSSWLNVEVSERLVTLVDFLKTELNKPEYHGRAEVRPFPSPEDTCRIGTDDGTIVATISAQADNLRTVFKRLS